MTPTRPVSTRERFNISRLAIKYPWLTLGFWVTVSVAGIVSLGTLKYALFPDITFPVVVVNATTPAGTALDTEAKLTRPIEQRLQALAGVDKVRSSSYPGQSVVSLSFAVGSDLERSSRIVETEIKRLSVPKGTAFEVVPLNLNESAAVSYAILSPSGDLARLTRIARTRIVPAIEKLPGVLKVTLLGAQGGSPAPTSGSLSAQESAIRLNGQDGLAFQVIKRGSANTLEVVDRVEREARRLQSSLGEVRLVLASTQAEYIREATDATLDALVLAVALSVLVIFPFLWNWQATLISALAIPTSLLGTFIVMAVFGFNLETITLLALALVIGIIIDDAIVDVENIARHLEEGEAPFEAAVSATNEIGLTVTAATLTIVAVFLPVGLMGGVVGQFFRPFGLTVSAAVITSLLVARTLSPLLAVWWLKPDPAQKKHQADGWSGFLQIYRWLLGWSLDHRWAVLGLAGLSFIGGLALIPLIPKGFIPHLDRGEFNITYTASPLVSLEESVQVARELEASVRRTPEVETIFTTVGSRPGEPNRGTLYVRLRDERTSKTFEIQDRIRRELPVLGDVVTSVEDIQLIDTGGEKPLQVSLLGDNLEELNRGAQAIKERIKVVPGFADVTITGAGSIEGITYEIAHLNGKRVIYLGANLAGSLALGEATDRIVAEAKAVLPPSVTLNLGADSERAAEVFGSFGITLGLSVLCILLVLVLLFKSWVDPLVIILSLPLSLVGAMLGLFLAQSDFGLISLIGVIFLLGLVNKNAILLVDYINQLRRAGLDRTEAILKAGPVRLRPILMTTAAATLGMLPLALGFGAGSELRSPMAIAIIGGLITSTLLSLVVVPVAYALLDDLRSRPPEKS
ncbi:MAG: efflux RND transporter permease subunit [Gemmatimonadaceae bacterium]|nr:efflux RND transporter permease subunit [Gloeobacterales cyanobacterium ES-bin-141]